MNEVIVYDKELYELLEKIEAHPDENLIEYVNSIEEIDIALFTQIMNEMEMENHPDLIHALTELVYLRKIKPKSTESSAFDGSLKFIITTPDKGELLSLFELCEKGKINGQVVSLHAQAAKPHILLDQSLKEFSEDLFSASILKVFKQWFAEKVKVAPIIHIRLHDREIEVTPFGASRVHELFKQPNRDLTTA